MVFSFDFGQLLNSKMSQDSSYQLTFSSPLHTLPVLVEVPNIFDQWRGGRVAEGA